MYNFFNIKLLVRFLNVLFLRIFLLTFLAFTFLIWVTVFYLIINILYSKDVSLFFYLRATSNVTILFTQYYFIITIICAVLFTFAYLHVRSELYIVKSCGSGFYKVMFYFLPSLICIFILTFYTNNYLVPNAQKNIITLTKELLYYNPIALIKERDFTNLFNKIHVYVESKENNEMKKVTIYKLEKNQKITFIADKAIIKCSEDQQGIQIELEKGYIYIDILNENRTIARSIRNKFSQQIINLNFNELFKDIFDINNVSCLDSLSLIKKIYTLKKDLDKNINANIMQYVKSDDIYKQNNDDLNIDFLQRHHEDIHKKPISINDIRLINKKYYLQISYDNIIYKNIKSYNEAAKNKFLSDIAKEKTELCRRNSIVLICCILFLLGIARGWLLSRKNYIFAMMLAICFAGIYYGMIIFFPQKNLLNIFLPVYIYLLLLLVYCIFANRDRWLYKKVRI